MTGKKITRRSFINASLSLTGIGLLGNYSASCSQSSKAPVKGSILGAASGLGHRLREMNFPDPVSTEQHDVVIVGGGIAGLTAARWLKKNNLNDILLLELDKEPGGNSTCGQNEVSAYPWGAHYLPLPNAGQPELWDFLQECNVITGFDDKNTPSFNEYYLCFDPEERLFIHGQWQEGLVPTFGVPRSEMKQIEHFFSLMDHFRKAKGNDGKYAFDIPVEASSEDEAFTSLDKMTMTEYLSKKGLRSGHLDWYIDYCCRDDYGTPASLTSAWAGVHYFASRKGIAANAEPGTVLTWPEGNGWLVKQLRKEIEQFIRKDHLVFSTSIVDGNVNIDCFDVSSNSSKRIIAKRCIMAVPQFINKRLLKSDTGRTSGSYDNFTYAPWMVANITLNKLPEKKGAPLSWDNVFYNSPSLGYVDATHQHLTTNELKKVITYYMPLSAHDPVTARKEAYGKTHAQWTEMILSDLTRAHGDMREHIENIDVWLWGHGMIRPVPGFITGVSRKNASLPIKDRIFFAHSDLSGISIFEEAFYHGTRAAKELIRSGINA